MLIVILVAIIVGIGGYFVYSNYSDNRTKTVIQQTLPLLPTSDTTVNWKTYTDIKRGFSLRYPPNWEVKNSDPNFANLRLIITKKNEQTFPMDTFNIDLSIEIKPLDQTLETFMKPVCKKGDPHCISGPPDKQENITIDNTQAIWQEKQYSAGGPYIKVFIPINKTDVLVFQGPNVALDIYYGNSSAMERAKQEGKQNINGFKKILSTLKFTN